MGTGTEIEEKYVNEFVEKIIIHIHDKSGGHRVQKTQIIFNFIGEFAPPKEFIPDKKKIPQDFFEPCGKLLPYQCRTLCSSLF